MVVNVKNGRKHFVDTSIIISNVIATTELNMVTDVLNLQQHGLNCKALFVPRHILNTVYGLANFATRVPVHQYIQLC